MTLPSDYLRAAVKYRREREAGRFAVALSVLPEVMRQADEGASREVIAYEAWAMADAFLNMRHAKVQDRSSDDAE